MSIVRNVKKIISAVIGFPLLVIGIILIPLPGPGLLISIVALYVLSLGFSWADEKLQSSLNLCKKIYRDAETRADRVEESLNKRWEKRQLRKKVDKGTAQYDTDAPK